MIFLHSSPLPPPQLLLPKKGSWKSMSSMEVEGEAMETVLLTNPGVCSCISCWVSLEWAFLFPLGVNTHWKLVLLHESQLVCSHGTWCRKSWALFFSLLHEKHLLLSRFFISEKVMPLSTTVLFWNRNIHRKNFVCSCVRSLFQQFFLKTLGEKKELISNFTYVRKYHKSY